jgi:hypothetical protein
MSAVHNLTFNTFIIYINVIAPSTIILSTWCLRFIYSSQHFVCLFLICHQCHIFVSNRPWYNQQCVWNSSSLTNGFPQFSKKNCGYTLNGENCLWRLCFWKWDPYRLSKRL